MDTNQAAIFLHENFDDDEFREIIHQVFALRQGYISSSKLRGGQRSDVFDQKPNPIHEWEIRIMTDDIVLEDLGALIEMVVSARRKYPEASKNRDKYGNGDKRKRLYYVLT
ncbi:hypothetical protein J2Z48_002968 [Croceifilum oryzae]|uniref:Uncharacterized protein n=1 Tax=Croceifilum oryzae TaxID=1553429 RepID=A0AAJ1THT9_9BACL|nr:hypothetical protein [Croceifilum oryzae]MDQ0418764.1 hypothetical protein [Croceifilum oryzae]